MARQDLIKVLSKRLKELMAKRGLTKAELSRKSGLPWLTIHRIEDGAVDPKASTIEKLAAALDVPPASLVAWF